MAGGQGAAEVTARCRAFTTDDAVDGIKLSDWEGEGQQEVSAWGEGRAG